MNLAHKLKSDYSFELSPIKGIELEASKMSDVVSLAQGVPTLRPFEKLHDFVIEKIREYRCDRYSLTNGLPELREAISQSLADSEGLSFDPDTEVIVTCGSIEGLSAALLATTSPGDEVILPSPTYASYSNCIRLAHCKPRYVELDEEQNFDFHIESLRAAITPRTRVLLFCLPNNPTGTIYSEEKLKQVLELAEKHDLMLIVDEVYKDFYYGEETHFSPLQLPGARERTIRVCSFSKAFALTGWRVGFLCAEKELSKRILGYHDAMVTCAPVASQYAGIAALQYGDEFLAWAKDQYTERRNYVLKRLDSLSRYFDYQVPNAGYFVFPRLKDSIALARDSKAFSYQLLNKAKVVTVYGSAFGPSGEGHIRMNFGREMDELKLSFDRIEDFLENSHSETKVKSLPISGTAGSQPSAIKSLARRTVSAAAAAKLRRSSSLVIAIAGLRAKTLFKRELSRQLRDKYKVRPGLLSYNTTTGLSLSVLGLTSPKTSEEKLSFPFKLGAQVLNQSDEHEILVLEYGAETVEEARALAAISKPDILIITPSFPCGPNSQPKQVSEALRTLLETAGIDNTIVCAEGYPSEFLEKLSPEQLIQGSEQTRQALAETCSRKVIETYSSRLEDYKTR